LHNPFATRQLQARAFRGVHVACTAPRRRILAVL
jgi:hypothetical protein